MDASNNQDQTLPEKPGMSRENCTTVQKSMPDDC